MGLFLKKQDDYSAIIKSSYPYQIIEQAHLLGK